MTPEQRQHHYAKVNDLLQQLIAHYETQVDNEHHVCLRELSLLRDYHRAVQENARECEKAQACDHEWVDDDIDLHPERSQRITYCAKCETTKH